MEIGACWYEVTETHRNILNEDLTVILWRQERGKQAWRWRESGNGSGKCRLCCLPVLHRLWTTYRPSTQAISFSLFDRELTDPTRFRWSLILYVRCHTFSLGILKKYKIQSSIPHLTNEHFRFSPSGMSWEPPVLFQPVSPLWPFPEACGYLYEDFRAFFTHLSHLDSRWNFVGIWERMPQNKNKENSLNFEI